MKVYISAWQGPWGWRNAFYEWYKKQPNQVFELVDELAEAEVVFQGDLNGWRDTVGLSPSVRILANVLDFGEWVNDGNLTPESVEYVNAMQKRGATFTGISPKVVRQLAHEFGIKASLFYYPSQVTHELIQTVRPAAEKKRNQIITFARLGDPGKAIPEALRGWEQSNLADRGWRWILAGPEPPQVDLPKGVIHIGYLERDQLYMMVAQSKYVFMPSYGEGLGLPIIEGLLVGTPFITRDIEPMRDLWSSLHCYATTSFQRDLDIQYGLHNAVYYSTQSDYMDDINRGFTKAHAWCREIAFESLATHIQKELINA